MHVAAKDQKFRSVMKIRQDVPGVFRDDVAEVRYPKRPFEHPWTRLHNDLERFVISTETQIQAWRNRDARKKSSTLFFECLLKRGHAIQILAASR
jgi:hypothetical protein